MLREGDGEWLYGDKWEIKIMVMANKNTINIITKKNKSNVRTAKFFRTFQSFAAT